MPESGINITTIIVWGGAGQVGFNTAEKIAYAVGEDASASIVLVDTPSTKTKLEGFTQKILECAAAVGNDVRVSHLTTDDSAGLQEALHAANIVINAAGLPRGIRYDFGDGRGPVEIKTREQTNAANASITREIASLVGRYARNQPLVIQIANQADTQGRLLHEMLTTHGYATRKIMSMNHLDQARLRVAVAHELNVDIRTVHALIAGTHDEFMVPLYSQLKVGGEYANLSEEQQQRITAKTREGGAWMMKMMGKSSEAEPAACAAAIVRAILCPGRHAGDIFNLGVCLQGEWGEMLNDGFMGLPCTVSKDGAVPIKRPASISAKELQDLHSALEHSRAMYASIQHIVCNHSPT